MSGIDTSFSLDYSALFNTGGSGSSTSASSSASSVNTSNSYNYGVNNAKLTEEQANDMLDFKSAALTLQNSLSTLLGKKNDGSSVFSNYSASSSDTEALTATYNNNIGKYSSEALLARRDPSYKPSAPEELSVKTLQLAQTQKNTGTSLASDGMALQEGKTYRFEISDGDTATEIAFVSEAGDTNESIMKKIASAVNEKNIGVRASVSTNDVTGESSLVFESRETGLKDGQDRSFEIRDVQGYDAVEKLGLDNVSQEAQNAKFYVKTADGAQELKESMSNTVNVTDRTQVTLKKETDDYVKVSFNNDSTSGINAVRELVNGFNALYDAASSGNTTASSRLASQLQGLADTYAKGLTEVGITRNADGYFEIDEDKMKKAAESGALENLFPADDKAVNYGFAKRLQNIASTVSDNPSQYVTGKSASQSDDAESRYANFINELNSGTNPSYSKLYFNMQRYENMGALFSSMF